MLSLLSVLRKDRFTPRFYIAAATDNMSLQKARTFEDLQGGMKVKADRDESSPYAAMLAAQDVAQRCKELGITAMHVHVSKETKLTHVKAGDTCIRQRARTKLLLFLFSCFLFFFALFSRVDISFFTLFAHMSFLLLLFLVSCIQKFYILKYSLIIKTNDNNIKFLFACSSSLFIFLLFLFSLFILVHAKPNQQRTSTLFS